MLEKPNSQLSWLANKNHLIELRSELFQIFSGFYVQYFIALCPLTTKKNYADVLGILDKTSKRFQELATQQQIKPPVIQKIMHDFKNIQSFFEQDDIDMVSVYLLNIIQIDPKRVNLNAIKTMLKSKVFFPNDSINYILEQMNEFDNVSTDSPPATTY